MPARLAVTCEYGLKKGKKNSHLNLTGKLHDEFDQTGIIPIRLYSLCNSANRQ
jgi:hypothetical protein